MGKSSWLFTTRIMWKLQSNFKILRIKVPNFFMRLKYLTAWLATIPPLIMESLMFITVVVKENIMWWLWIYMANPCKICSLTMVGGLILSQHSWLEFKWFRESSLFIVKGTCIEILNLIILSSAEVKKQRKFT